MTVRCSSLVHKRTRLLNTWTWGASWTITLITTFLIGCVLLLLSSLLFIFLFFEFHNFTLLVFLAESLTAPLC